MSSTHFSDALQLLSSVPLIRAFSMDINGEFTIPNLPLHQLTHLCLKNRDGDFALRTENVLQLLKDCVTLQDLEIKVHVDDDEQTIVSAELTDSVMIRAEHLRRLSFEDDVVASPPPIDIFEILKKLVAPKLEDLQIGAAYELDPEYEIYGLDRVKDFIDSSSCQLRSLTLHEYGGNRLPKLLPFFTSKSC
ncbi:hypothetical protein C8J56DRAFT_1066759 [Mycena floridula]|nr:hypothetical protein C8J56DRAFT_1066759 [Mycena floridula]